MAKKLTYEELEQRIKKLEGETLNSKQIELSQKKSEASYRAIVAAFDGLIYVCSQDYRIEFMNDRFIERTGYDPTGELCYKALHELDSVCPWCVNERVFRGETVRWEMQSPKDQRWYYIVNTPIYHPDGNLYKQAMINDITERKQIEEALRESEKKYRDIFENAIEGFFQSTPEGHFVSVNPSFAKMLGYESPEDIISNVSDIAKQYYVNPEDRNRYQHLLQKNGRVENFEFKVRRKDGSQIWVSNSTRAYFDKEGKVVRYEGIVIDISERKRAEKEKAELQSQLLQAYKMESIGNLAGGIAHDFNNILGIIIGNAELALDDIPEQERVRFNLEEIRTASERAKDVVKQLLSFARKTELEKKPIKLIPVVKDSIKFLRTIMPTSIDVRHNILATDETILADPTQIHQVMINLCTNASYAMQETGGILGIKIENVFFKEQSDAPHPDLLSGSYVKLTVSDTGQGIHPEIKDRIFDPYFTTKEIGKGTGMGLSVVHGIVNNYGGTISVESEVGKGTTFYIYFPVVEEAAVVETETIEEVATGNERILFVDDDKSLTDVCRYRLERLGYQVETKTNPVEALELFRANPDRFDLIITDMTMPQMTGDHLVKEILKIRPDTLIILCTGFSEKMDEEKAKEIGAAEYIEKPLYKRDLAIKIRRALDGKKGKV